MNMLANPYWMGAVSLTIILVAGTFLIHQVFQFIRFWRRGYARPWQRLWRDY